MKGRGCARPNAAECVPVRTHSMSETAPPAKYPPCAGAERRLISFGKASLAALVIIFAGALRLAGGPVAAQEKGLFERETLTGDWGGKRQQLQNAGVDLGLTDVAETLSNPVGGMRQSTIYQGLLTASLALDLERLAHWQGASFYVDGYQISGRGLSRNAIGNLLAVSTIEALPSTRLHDLWLQQEFAYPQTSLRVGQIALDDEFYISKYSSNFVNSTFGCPDLLAVDLPSGGPCYPFAAPGARLLGVLASDLTLSGAAFNGNPAPPGPGDPQVRNSNGTNFLIGQGGFLVMAELAYTFDQEPTGSRLSGVKLGGWYHTATFPDLRRDSSGRSLADPASNGTGAAHNGNLGFYLVLDKTLWRPPGAATSGLAGFVRVGGALPDRNLISLEIDAGLTYNGLFPGRELDLLGVAFAYGRISNSARNSDRDALLFTGIGGTLRDYEAVLEITYQAYMTPWWVLQPDLQVVLHPGGHIAAPFAAPATRPIPNALVLGLRSALVF